jgi:hypothetical protein
MRRWPIIVSIALALGALSGAAAYQQVGPRQDQRQAEWREIAWPFPRDGWPAGKAFRCDTAACGREVAIYVRPKIGFCNCDRGVEDDDEVDRVADVDLINERFVPLRTGQVIRVADMPGRIRMYALPPAASPRHAVGIAVSRGCDLLVAVAHGNGDESKMRRAALAFLETSEMTRWVMAAMEGR